MSTEIALDGSRLRSAAEVYALLAPAIGAPAYCGANPDALWDVLTEHGPIDLAVVWSHPECSAGRLGGEFSRLVRMLRAADDAGLLSFRFG